MKSTVLMVLPRLVAVCLAVCSGALLASCANDSGGGSAQVTADTGAGTDALFTFDTQARVDSQAPADMTAVPDGGAGGQDAPVLPGGDAVDASAGQCPGAAGCACTDNGQCQGGLCLEDPGAPSGLSCAKKCETDCPPNYKCASVSGAGGDIQNVCVWRHGHLCDPCDSSAACNAIGLPGSVCVDQGALGRYCGVACLTDADCPDLYACQDVTSAEGAASKQCVRKPDSLQQPYGVCPCSDKAKKGKLSTACWSEAKGATGEVTGKCPGVRSCGADGLGICTAPTVQAEVCDGKDNDCDGKTDEAGCDDNNVCTKDSCDPAKGCGHIPLDGDACDADGSLCTESDHCVTGTCTAGKAKNCGDDNPCTQDACDGAKGCTHTNDDGAPCDDGFPCTKGDTCAAGACKGGAKVTCDNGDPCLQGVCNLADGKCKYTPEIGKSCDDGSACTAGDACDDQALCKGKQVVCDDANACTLDSCAPATGCKSISQNGNCDDGNTCTAADQCDGGSCKAGSAVTCDDSNPCTADSCDPKLGCLHDGASTSGLQCNADDSLCTSGDSCSGGKCLPGAPLSCVDGNPCTDDTCSAKDGCVFPANTAICNDSDPCTTADHCEFGKCVGNNATCDDGLPCTIDSCVAPGGCSHKPSGGPCDDGSKCTSGDSCATAICKGTPLACNDGNPCTDDSCDPTIGCVFSPNGAGCDDGNACTFADKCSGGKCTGSGITCDDGNPCTADSCNPNAGCQAPSVLDGTSCGTDMTCSGGVCKATVCHDTVTLNYKGIVDQVTIPACAKSVVIKLAGAQGGTSTGGSAGGLGATISGTWTPPVGGATLHVVVGQQAAGAPYPSGGGGGTFVAYNNQPLLVAGGGGGGYLNWAPGGSSTALVTSGVGTGGLVSSNGGGGGGFTTDGQPVGAAGGQSFVNGAKGGKRYPVGEPNCTDGGFGGGGGSSMSGNFNAGGGGGFNGGNSGNGNASTGGASYYAASITGPAHKPAANAGNGSAVISW